jgi:hypothetical protein
MAFVVNDRVKETSTTIGTSTLNLAGAEDGFETFVAGVGTGNTTYYAISQNDSPYAWEVGVGTVTSGSPDTLSRDIIISSSNSDTVVNFSAGIKNVFVTLPASKTILTDPSSNIDVTGDTFITTSDGNITLTPNGTGKVSISSILYPNADGTADQVLTTNGSGTLSFADVAGGAAWQAVKTTNFNVAAGEGYFVNTSGGAITATLPASPSLGDFASFVDYAGTFDTENLTLARNGKNIQGAAADLTVNVERAGFTLVFVDDTQGWLLQNK